MTEILKQRINRVLDWYKGESMVDEFDNLSNEYKKLAVVLGDMFWRSLLTSDEWHELRDYLDVVYHNVFISMK